MITPCGLARFVLDLGKATFDNTFTTVATVQEWVEDGVRHVVGTVPLVPVPVRDVVRESLGFVSRTRGDFKHTVDRCYHLVSDMLAGCDTEAVAHDGSRPAAPAPARRAS